MSSKCIVAFALSALMLAESLISPISIYAENTYSQPVDVETSANGSDSESTDSSEANKQSLGDSSAENPDEQDASDQQDSDRTSEQFPIGSVQYVYMDDSLVSVGNEWNVVIGLANLSNDVSDAQLVLRKTDSTTVEVPLSAYADGALRFSGTFSTDSDADSYTIDSLLFVSGNVTYSVSFSEDSASENSYSFEVVRKDTAAAIESADNDGVSALHIDDDGQLVAEDSVEDALAAADESGVSESISDSTAISTYSSSSRSAVNQARENYLIVALDPGHGGSDTGACANGVVERDVNWSIANHFKDELSTYTGVTPYLTTNGEEPGLQTRVDRAVAVGADVFVSVHVNSASASAYGAEVWVPNSSSFNYSTHVDGQELGAKIEAQLVALGLGNRGVKTRDWGSGSDSSYPDGSMKDYYSVIRNARLHGIPGIIVEHAFVTNPSDAANLANDSFRTKLGIADATGVAQQYNLGKDADARAVASVAVKAHVANLGWESTVYDNKIAGTTGKSFNLEAFQISALNGVAASGGVEYRSNVDGSWQGWVSNGVTSGTTGQSKAVQAVQIKLTGDAASKYDIYYRIHAANFGWLGWAKNGESAGSVGYGNGAQALEVVVVVKGAAAPGSTDTPFRDKAGEPMSLTYRVHVSGIGWQSYTGGVAGTTGQSKAMEALQLSLENAKMSGTVESSAHVSGIGWQGYVAAGGVSGTTGQSRSVEAFRFRLTGDLAQRYDIWYRVHASGFGWMGWAKNGEKAGSQGYSRHAEAVEIRLVEKGAAAPGSTDTPFRDKAGEPMSLTYRVHVSGIGWQSYTGGVAGTTGQSKAMEALQLSLENAKMSGTVESSAHVSGIGWQGYVAAGGVSGTTGQSRSVEAFRFRLTGDLAQRYDIWYRVHASGFGWMGWAKNGEKAGSQGYSRHAEAVEIRLVEKGAAAPGSTDTPFRDKADYAIMGSSKVTAAQMAACFKSTGNSFPSNVYSSKGAKSIDDFCRIIVEEASAEGVRAEVVFAQSMLETGWLKFGGSVRPEQCNFSGLGATSPTVGGATFDSVALGVRAQVQHLKAYATTESLNRACVDPRFNLVQRGVAPFITDLNGRWAVPGTYYGQNIYSIITRIA